MGRLIDITGKTYNQLTVLKQVESRNESAYWLCRCTCGVEKVVQGTNLRNGSTKSCGCLNKSSIGKDHSDHRTDYANVGRPRKNSSVNTSRTSTKVKTTDYRAEIDHEVASWELTDYDLNPIPVNYLSEPVSTSFEETKTLGDTLDEQPVLDDKDRTKKAWKIHQFRKINSFAKKNLSDEQVVLLIHLMQGHSLKQIAALMNITPFHHIYWKAKQLIKLFRKEFGEDVDLPIRFRRTEDKSDE